MQYHVQLSDHDFVVAKSHKLIPSVIAAMKVKENCIGEQVDPFAIQIIIFSSCFYQFKMLIIRNLNSMNSCFYFISLQGCYIHSGPTYVGIRSAKHTTSSAYAHLKDMNRVHELSEFKESLFMSDDISKLMMIVTVDGGPDENPR